MANIDSSWVPAVDLDSAVQMSRRAFPHPNTWRESHAFALLLSMNLVSESSLR